MSELLKKKKIQSESDSKPKDVPFIKEFELNDEQESKLDLLTTDLLELDDSELLKNFDILENCENLKFENLFIEGDDLNVDMNLSVDVPSYLNDISMMRTDSLNTNEA